MNYVTRVILVSYTNMNYIEARSGVFYSVATKPVILKKTWTNLEFRTKATEKLETYYLRVYTILNFVNTHLYFIKY